MALEFKTIHLPVSGGVEQGTDDINQPAGMVAATNVRFFQDGSAEKRPGHEVISTLDDVTGQWDSGSYIVAGSGRLIASGDRLMLADGFNLHHLASTGSTAKWSNKGPIPTYTGTSKPHGGTNRPITHIDQCVATSTAGNKYRVVVISELRSISSFAQGGIILARVIDESTGNEVNTTGAVGAWTSNTEQISESHIDLHCAHAVAVGTKVVVSYSDVNSNNIYYRVLDVDTMAWGSQATWCTTNLVVGGLSNAFDFKPAGSEIHALWQDTGYLVRATRLTISGTTLSVGTTITVENTSPIQATGFGITPFVTGDTCPVVLATYGFDDGVKVIARLCGITVSGFSTVAAAQTIKSYTSATLAKGDYLAASSSAVDQDDSTLFRVGLSVLTGYFTGNAAAASPTNSTQGHLQWGTSFHSVDYDGATTFTTAEESHFARTLLLSSPWKYSGSGFVGPGNSGKWFCAVQKFSGLHIQNDGVFANGNKSVFGSANQDESMSSPSDNFGSTFIVGTDTGIEDACFFPRQTPQLKWDPTAAFDTAELLYAMRTVVTQYVSPSELLLAIDTADSNSSYRSSANLVELSTDDSRRYHYVSSDEGPYISGGLVGYADRRTFSNVGVTFPAGYVTYDYTGAGTLLTDGTSFCYVHEFVDNDGNVRRSPPSSVWVNGTHDGAHGRMRYPSTLYVPYQWDGYDKLALKYRTPTAGNCAVVLYGGSSADSMYELARADAPPELSTFWEGVAGGTLLTFTVSDQPSSASDGREFVYTSGGVLPDVMPPASICMVEYRGSLVSLDHTRRRLWISKQLLQGETASFTDDVTVTIPFDADAIASMDGDLYVFGRAGIGVMTGDPPDDLGNGSTLSPVAVIAADHGCTNANSVVVTPAGIMFRSPVGFYLLDRGKNIKFIGEQVMESASSYPNVLCAVRHPTDSVVLFSCDDGQGNGLIFVYNYRLGRWSTDTVPGDARIVSMASVGDSLYKLDDAGRLLKERARGSCLDESTFVTSTLVFAPHRPGGVQGFGRLRSVSLIGRISTNCDISVSVAYDDATAYDYTGTYQNVSDSLTSRQFFPARQLGRSFRVKYTDASPTGGSVGLGAGLKISGVALTVGTYDGAQRLDSGKRK